MSNFQTLFNFEILRSLRRKSFWISSFAVPIVILFVFTLMQLGTLQKQKSDDLHTTELSIEYKDYSGIINPSLAAEVNISESLDEKDSINRVQAGKLDAFILYPESVASGQIRLYENGGNLLSNSKTTALALALMKKSASDHVESVDLAIALAGEANIKRIAYKEGVVDTGIAGMVVPLVFLVVFFAIAIFSGNQLLVSFAEEKEQKVREVLFTSANPRSIFYAKVSATGTLTIIQVFVMVVPILIGYLLLRNVLNLPMIDIDDLAVDVGATVMSFILMIFGVMMVVVAYAFIGVKIKSVRDGSTIATALVVGIFMPTYLLRMIIDSPNDLIVQIMTYFPLTAPSTSLLRSATGSMGLIEFLSVTLVLCTTIMVLARIAADRYVGRSGGESSFSKLIHAFSQDVSKLRS